MQPNEYSTACDTIITGTMSYIDTSKMKRYNIDKTAIPSNDIIYTSAVTSSAPITLVYTPAGTGKSALSKDRVKALEASGVPSHKIMLLNMNIAKVKQMSAELPGVNVMTFNDFTHGIFAANFPQCELSDINSVLCSVMLQPEDKTQNAFTHLLAVNNPQDRATLLTLFVNKHIDYITHTLTTIKKADYSLESMVCQNTLYALANNPYDIDTIIINGVHNMPVPVLCTILEYANRFHCNLFMTGSPDETIYEFNMAYNNAMNVLSSYTNLNIDIIRLTNANRMSHDILNVLNMMPTDKINDITMVSMKADKNTTVESVIQKTMNPCIPYIKDKLDNHQPVLILARSKSDINDIKQVITNSYSQLYPNMKIADLTAPPVPNSCYGKLASKYFHALTANYPQGISAVKFFYELYNIIKKEIDETDNNNIKTQYTTGLNELVDFLNIHNARFAPVDKIIPVSEIIQTVIDIESETIQAYMNNIRNDATPDIPNSDIILSTIHTAIDIRMDHVIVFMRNFNEHTDTSVYRVALSRANKSEYIVFMNYGMFEVSYQQYIKARLPMA